jgi:hypothetical protein
MPKPQKTDKNVIDIDPVTLLFIVGIVILLPLLLTGFLSQ